MSMNRQFIVLTIRQKIWLVFLLGVSGYIAVNAFMLYEQNAFQRSFNTVVTELNPTTTEVLTLNAELEATMQDLTLYLLSKDDQQLQGFEQRLAQLQQRVTKLAQLEKLMADQSANQAITNIAAHMKKIDAIKAMVVELSQSLIKNYPAQELAATRFNPLAEQINSQLGLITGESPLSSERPDEPLDFEHELQTHRKVLIWSEFTRLQDQWNKVLINFRGYLGMRTENLFTNAQQYFELLKQQISTIETFGDQLSFEQEEALAVIKGHIAELETTGQQIHQLHQGKNWRQDSQILRQEVAPLLADIRREIHKLAELKQTEVDSINQQILDRVSRDTTVITLLSAVGLIIGVLLVSWMARDIGKRFCSINQALGEIAKKGNLAIRLDDSQHDEMGAVAANFNAFATKIKGVVDLVIASSVSLSGEAQRMSNTTEQTKERVVNQQSEVQQVTHTMGDMNSMVQQVAGDAQTASDAAREASQQAASGRAVVDETVELIHGLTQRVDQAVESMAILEQESKAIETILTTIREISEHTNLLALNAAIEAARAGEQGRGFAVVADEVRTLANRTDKETTEIQRKIEQLQSNAQLTAEVMNKGKEMAHRSCESATQAGQSLASIVGSVGTITDMNDRIAEATQRQHQLATGLNQRIHVISDIADETAESAVQTTSLSHELSTMAEQLQGIVQQFLLNENEEARESRLAQSNRRCGAGNYTQTEEDTNTTLF